MSTNVTEAPDAASIGINDFEREKWKAEHDQKVREMDLKVRAQDLAEKEHIAKREEAKRAAWYNPLVVAIIAATAAAIGNAFIAYTNGKNQRDLEAEKSEQTRILEMIKTGDADSAAANLRFLVETGLITNATVVSKLDTYLNTRQKGKGASLPAHAGVFGGISGIDDAKAIDQLSVQHPLRKVSSAVGRVHVNSKVGNEIRCTGFLVGKDLLVTAKHCLSMNSNEEVLLVMGSRIGDDNFRVIGQDLLPSSQASQNDGFVLLRVEGAPGEKYGYLKIGGEDIFVKESLSIVFFRDEWRRMAVADSPDCVVSSIGKNHLRHGCDTGAGSSGAPIMDRATNAVVGVHVRRTADGNGEAARVEGLSRIIEKLR